jgi:glutamine cyclotransferase
MRNKIYLVFVLLFIASCTDNTDKPSTEETAPPAATVPLISYSIKEYLPHDSNAFTEGLLVKDGVFYESTGSPADMPQTRSLFGIVDPKTGRIDVKGELDRNKYFGEGIVILNDKLYQLTYKNKQGFVYDAKTFKKIKDFSYANEEGWGLTTDNTHLIMSDGTSNLTYLDPENLTVVKTLNVTEDGYQRNYLNELEYIKGFIYANVWTTNYIVKIDPATGQVVGKLDLNNLAIDARNKYRYASEMNGIAYDAQADKIYVTGKLWPNIYQIEFAH